MNRLPFAGLALILTGCFAPPPEVAPVEVRQDALIDTTAMWVRNGGVANELLGAGVAGVGDVNGDGYEDVVVGLPGSGNGGAISLFLGDANGPAQNPVWSATFADGCDLGHNLARLGDVNGDGFDDIVAGDDCAAPTASGEGRVHVWYGQANPNTLPAVSDWTATGGSASAEFGSSVAATDLDNDGFADLIVGAPGLGAGGSVQVFMGGATGLATSPAVTLTEPQSGAFFGSAVASAGDVDGDGRGDVLIGAALYDAPVAGTDAGRVQLYLATGSTPPLSLPAWTEYGEATTDRLGANVAGLGDVDGDGDPDLAASAITADAGNLVNAGRVYVWGTQNGAVNLTPQTFDGGLAQENWGEELTGVGDINADGYADMGVGGPGSDVYAVVFGGASGLEASPSFQQNGSLGSGAGAIAGAGDVDGDGVPDVIVGAAFDNVSDQGSARIFGGLRTGPSETIGDFVFGSQAGMKLGAATHGVGDVNGDGYDDVLVGAHEYSNGETGEGAAFIYLGTSVGLDVSAPAWSAESDTSGANFGESVSGLGDINGDGYADWVVGAPDYGTTVTGGLGRISVYLGSPSIGGTLPHMEVNGGVPNARLGSDVSGGDVNGDGFADVIAGARLYTSGESNEGAVWVWFGSPAGVVTTPGWTTQSNVSAAQLGSQVAFLGDVNGDGFGDFGASGPSWNDGTTATKGAVLVWHGAIGGPGATADWTFGAFGGWNAFGTSMDGAGDVNGDGYDDLIVGDPTAGTTFGNDGKAAVHLGAAGGLESTAAWATVGNLPNMALGTSVAGAGDVNGDGYADVAVGGTGTAANGVSGAGQARIFPGSAAGPATNPMFLRVGSQTGQSFGNAVESAGDVNGDGVDDFVGAAWLWDVTTSGDEGRITVFPGNAADGFGGDPSPLALQLQDSTGTPIVLGSRSPDPTTASLVSLAARGPFGPTQVALEAELQPVGAPFDGQSTVLGPWAATGPSAVAVSVSANSLTPNTPMRWRARLRYRSTRGIAQSWGPWISGDPARPEGLHFTTGCTSDLDADGLCDVDDPDADGDGFDAGPDDCDDTDATVFAGATESCDAVDSDCDSSIVDEFDDTDGDGDPDCNDTDDDGDGEPDDTDCAPLDADRFPGNPEVCDGLDNDCDGAVPGDEADADGDNWTVCGGDCDDTNTGVNPGKAEANNDCVDTDCDGTIPPAETADSDLDGVQVCAGDCDDTDPTVQPGAPELCDGKNTDCDGPLDTDGLFTGETDDDGDGFAECEGDCDDDQDDQYPGAPEAGDSAEDLNCDGVFGQGTDADGDGSATDDAVPDCDDGDPARYPGAEELCDGIDNDCDGLAWSETADGDGDGFVACLDCNEADPSIPTTDTQSREVCDGWNSDCDPDGFPDPDTEDYDLDGDGVAACEGDCDDTDASINPDLPEVCGNGMDDDCDGSVDEDVDADGDGVTTCGGDCDDADDSVFDGATEVCDGVDQNCDGAADEPFDADGDGVGDCLDCDDADANTYPGAPELCDDARDNDCNPATLPFIDGDGDGFAACPDGDCDDTSDAVSPAHDEVCDGIDNNCDGQVDENLDVDNDGLLTCTGDCAEGDPTVRAGLPEVCDDGIDQDCDQLIDDGCDGPGTLEPLDIVFPAGCVCDSDGPGGLPGALALFALLGVTGLRRRP